MNVIVGAKFFYENFVPAYIFRLSFLAYKNFEYLYILIDFIFSCKNLRNLWTVPRGNPSAPKFVAYETKKVQLLSPPRVCSVKQVSYSLSCLSMQLQKKNKNMNLRVGNDHQIKSVGNVTIDMLQWHKLWKLVVSFASANFFSYIKIYNVKSTKINISSDFSESLSWKMSKFISRLLMWNRSWKCFIT